MNGNAILGLIAFGLLAMAIFVVLFDVKVGF